MMGKALMATPSVNRIESVLAGIRGYLTEQLGEQEQELEAAQKSVAELEHELAAQRTSLNHTVASRDLLAAKLAELESATTDSAATVPAPADSAVVAKAGRSRRRAAAAVAPGITEATEGDAVVGALPTGGSPAVAPAAASAKQLNASQRAVVEFLEGATGVHKVVEIAVGVSGPDAGSSAVQTVRRALNALTASGLVAKSTQSGTAFYSAVPAAPVAAPTAPAKASPAAATVTDAPAKPAKAAKRAAGKRAANGKPAPRKSTKKPAGKVPAKGKAAPATTGSDAAAAADKSVRADRARIVRTLQEAGEPQSAGDLSRTMMGDRWRSSDATNFRNVLKSLVTKGVVTEHVGANNRARYSAAPTS